MISKKVLVILVIVAIVLVAVAYTVTSNSEKIKTNAEVNSAEGGKVGVTILPSNVEDKLENGGQG